MLWTLLGRIAIALAQAGLLILAARLGSAEMVGDVALAMALCSPIMVVVGLQQRVVLVTDTARRFGWRTHVRLRLCAMTLGTAVVCLIAATPWIPVSATVAGALTLAKAGDLWSDLHHAVFQLRGAMRLYARSLLLRGSAGLLALAIVLPTTGELWLGLLAMASVSWMVALLHDAPWSARLQRPEGRRPPGRTSARRGPRRTGSSSTLLWVAAPLGLVTFVDSIAQHALRIQVDALLGTAALGHYAAMSYMVIAGGAVVFSLGTPLLPRLAAHHAAGRRRAFQATAVRLVGLSAGLGILGITCAAFAGRPFLGLLFGAAFADSAAVFPWVMAAGAMHFVLGALVHALNAAQRRRSQPWIYLCGLATTLAAGWMWIPAFGLYGAAFASMFGWGVAVVVAATLLRSSLPREAA